MPILSQEMPFVEAVAKAEGNDINLFFACPEPVEGNDPGSKVQVNLLNSFNLDFSKYKKIGIFIGPEGGWTEEELGEVESFKLKVGGGGFKVVGLSPFTLRAETAAITAIAVITQSRTF